MDFLFGIIVGVIGVYVYDTYIMKRTKYRSIDDDKKGSKK